MDVALQIIQTIGFPIAACIFMGYFVKKQNDQYREDLKEMMNKYDVSIEKFGVSIDENTKVLAMIEAKISKDAKG